MPKVMQLLGMEPHLSSDSQSPSSFHKISIFVFSPPNFEDLFSVSSLQISNFMYVSLGGHGSIHPGHSEKGMGIKEAAKTL